MVAESQGQVLAQIAAVRADITRQTARALQVRRQLDADVVEPALAGFGISGLRCHRRAGGSSAELARHAIGANEQLEAVTGVDLDRPQRIGAARGLRSSATACRVGAAAHPDSLSRATWRSPVSSRVIRS
jgi:hypothetical protein